METPKIELEFRRRRFEQLEAAYSAADDDAYPESLDVERSKERPEALEILERFRSARDLDAFRYEMDVWSKRSMWFGFKGPNGQMFLNQLVSGGDSAEIVNLLLELLAPPGDVHAAEVSVDRLAAHTVDLRKHGSPAQVGRVPFLLSWLWWLQEPEKWATLWPSVERSLIDLGFMGSSYTEAQQGARYADYVMATTDLGPTDVVERVFGWLDEHRGAPGLDPTLLERCVWAGELSREPGDADPAGYEANRSNVRVILADLHRFGRSMAEPISEALDRNIKVRVPSEFWAPERKRIRGDGWVSWAPSSSEGAPSANLVLVVEPDRILIALNPYVARNGRGFTARAVEALRPNLPDGITETTWSYVGAGPDKTNSPGHVLFGREIAVPIATALHSDELCSIVRDTAAVLRPCFELVESLSGPIVPSVSAAGTDGGGPTALTGSLTSSLLESLAEDFRADRPYPNERDAWHQAERKRYADLLRHDALASLDIDDLRRLYNGNAYGNPGPQSILNVTLRDGSDADWDRFLKTLDYLLWEAQDDFDHRIDRVLDESDHGIRGFKEAVILKLLAVCHPERFLPVFPYTGRNGKAAFLQQLGLPVPLLSASAGQRHLQANDRLREALEPLFPDDPWGQGQFLYWLLEREPTEGRETTSPGEEAIDPIGEAADDLLLNRAFLDDVVSLLEETKQVIFYGPPRDREDLRRPGARQGNRERSGAMDACAVSPLDELRGLLRGLPTRTQPRRWNRVRATRWSLARNRDECGGGSR